MLRRYSASEKIAKVCPMLKRSEWTHLGIDSEGNNQQHKFVIQEEDEVGGKNTKRVVRLVMDWWMEDQYKDEHGGPLPDNMVEEENPWWKRHYFPGE